MTMAPVRPIFQNGQRLTAERLTQALEFLRTMLRRVLLAPLSAGVAEGFEFTPPYGETSDTLTVSPGLAIDGRGRLMVVPQPTTFTLAQIMNAAGVANASPTQERSVIVRVCLALDDASLGLDPCDPHRPLDIEEDAKFIFQVEPYTDFATQVVQQFRNPNCVPSWDDLDQTAAGSDPCCVTLGHLQVFGYSPTEGGGSFEATTFFRQGVCPRFNVIRNTDGEPSIFFNQIQYTNTSAELAVDIDEPGVGIPVTTLIGPKPMVVTGDASFFGKNTAFFNAGGLVVQATHVGPFGAPYRAGAFAADPDHVGNSRVFLFGGGAGDFDASTQTSELPAGLGGASAVPCEVEPGSASIDSAGVPLGISSTGTGDLVRVVRTTTSDQSLLALSAGREVAVGATRVVPVATTGLVKTTVQVPSGGGIVVGDRLTAAVPGTPPDDGLLKPASASDYVVAVAAQQSTGSGKVPLFVWVRSPAVPL